MLNFKKFLTNVGAFSNGTNDYDYYTHQMLLPLDTIDLPTHSTPNPVKVFKINKKGKSYEICAEQNVTWYIPCKHYEHLLKTGKAPQVGDKIMLTFCNDGSVQSFEKY